jgi:hypothetical protein
MVANFVCARWCFARIANIGILQTTGYHANGKMSVDETGLLLLRIGFVLTGKGRWNHERVES